MHCFLSYILGKGNFRIQLYTCCYW